MRIKLLQFGDLHIDAPFTSLSGMEGRPQQRRHELKKALARLIDLADSESTDMVLVCGDLYEHGYTGKSSIHFICDQFERISHIPVLIIPGNHDPRLAGSYYEEHVWPSNAHILRDNDVFECRRTGTRVYGGLGFGKADPSFINILMYHGTLDMPFSTGAFRPISSKQIALTGIDYCALGHFHSTFGHAGTEGIFFNAGSPEPLGFDETGDHGAFVTVIDKEPGKRAAINAEFISICSRRFFDISVNISGCFNSEQAAGVIEAEMEKMGSDRDLYRISMEGRIPAGAAVDAAEIVPMLAGKVFCLKIVDNTVPDYDLVRIAQEQGLRGLFVRKMMERAESAPDEESARVVLQALYYGLDAIGEGRICI